MYRGAMFQPSLTLSLDHWELDPETLEEVTFQMNEYASASDEDVEDEHGEAQVEGSDAMAEAAADSGPPVQKTAGVRGVGFATANGVVVALKHFFTHLYVMGGT